MKKHLLIIGICIVILLIPISSAVGVNKNVDDKGLMNSEVEPLDTNKEIFTKIVGAGYDVVIHSKKGLVYDVTFYAGNWGTWFEIWGWKYPFPSRFNEIATHIHAGFFIGFIREIDYGNHIIYNIRGIAIGDIEWSK